MPKRGRQKRREAKQKPKQKRSLKSQQSRKKKLLAWGWKFAVAALGLIASVVGVDSYISSRITVTPTSPVDLMDTFSTPFIITNNGWLDLNKVEVSCIYEKILDVNYNTWTNVGQSGFIYDEVEPNHPTTVLCRLIKSDAPFSKADMKIVISYRPSFIPWRKAPESFRYTVERGSDGTLHWLPQSNEK